MKQSFFFLALVLFLIQCKQQEVNTIIQFPGKPEVPSSIKQEHDYLLDEIHKITLFQDSTGRAALKLYELMKHHFKEEEDFVLPPLGLLPSLANGQLPEQSDKIIQLAEKLKSQLSHMNAEHQFIKVFMNELMQAANKESHPELTKIEKMLHNHATMEEEVFFSTAILIGEYLKIKLK